MGENIGAAARAMANFGLTDLRLVRPRDGWPNRKAQAAASGATGIVDEVTRLRVRRGGDCRSEFRLCHDGARSRFAEADFRPARRGGGASRAHNSGAGGRRALRARAVGADQRGGCARRRDRHISGQSEICFAQHRPSGAPYRIRVDDRRARRRVVDPYRRSGHGPDTGAEGTPPRIDTTSGDRARSDRLFPHP